MAQYILFVLEEEQSLIKKELSAATVCTVIFDGSTRQGEALTIIIRYIDLEWEIQQRLLRFHTLAKNLNASQLAPDLHTDSTECQSRHAGRSSP